MERSALDQAVEVLTRAQRGVLLLVPPDPPGDAFSAMVGLSLALDTLPKPTTLVCPSHVPKTLQFLPGTSQVHDHFPHSPELVLHLPIGDRPPEYVRWEVVDKTLRITVCLSPSAAATPVVDLQRGDYPWDCIVTVGVPRLHALGEMFTEHAPFFYQTPLVNIDRGTANEFFGTVNLVPATAGTVSEVVTDLLGDLGGTTLLSPEVATCLLAGVMTGTHSFRAPWTTPRTFQTASLLMEQNADRQTVVRRLFHTHTLHELRLLGRALNRMEELTPRALWGLLTHEDFAESGSAADVAPTVFQELLQWVGDRRTVFLVFERHPGTLETLVSLGRVSADDREVFRAQLHGVRVGPWVLITLGTAPPTDTRKLLLEHIVPHIPKPAEADA